MFSITMRFFISTIFVVLFCDVQAVIYYLNDTEYNQFPSVYHLDDFANSLHEYGHSYCMVDFELVSDSPSSLLTTIREYSEHSVSHFNHTQLRYGIDVLKTCRHMKNKVEVTDWALEGCLNETFRKQYNLGVRLTGFNCDHTSNNTFDMGDVIVTIMLLFIVTLNVAGTILDVLRSNDEDDNFLFCFSLRKNWRKLTTSIEGPDPRLDAFQGLNGIKIIVLVGVVAAHSMWPFLLLAKHTHAIELSYYDPLQYFLLNGTLAIQTFFVLTGLLMSYKMLLYLETVEPDWKIIYKGIFLRWLRLTPSYAVALALMATFIRFMRHGPQWEVSAGLDVVDCRSRWWLNLLYFNNYVYNAQCMPHSWYIAADFQLCCIGMTAIILIQRLGFKKTILTVLFMIGIIVPAIQTYVYDLDAVLITSPGATRTFFATDPTFNETYKTGHSNLSSFVIGLVLGYVVYYRRKRESDVTNIVRYRYIYWAVAPLIFAYILAGYVFYRDAPRVSLYIRILTSALAKPIFGMMLAVVIAGLIFKIENFYRSVLEWNIWTVPGRLSYCIYILHLPFIRIFAGSRTTLVEASKYNFFALMFSVLVLSSAMAVPLWLLVESPFYELVKRNPNKKQNQTYLKQAYTTRL